MRKGLLFGAVVSISVLTIGLASAAYAGETEAATDVFTLRNGITFDDNVEDVKSKETLKVKEERDEETNKPSLSVENATVAGIDDTTILYLFDDDERLQEMSYRFDSTDFQDIMLSNYEDLYDGLVRKYGEPLGYTNGDSYLIVSDAFELAAFMYMFFDMGGGVGDYDKYAEWVVEGPDYNVKIDIMGFHYGSSYSDVSYNLYLSYRRFTDDELKEKQQEKQDKRDTVDNDL